MEIISVGIDIGTSTTQVVFSRISIENTASYFSIPRVDIIDKKVIYKSKIRMTPLKNEVLIDGDAVRSIVEEEYRNAGFTPDDIDTGAVIITGESALKENANIVLEKLSSFAGEFVVSTAGPDLEAIIAGKGSGAQQYSIDKSCIVANLDIGGGTTNVVVFDNGEVVSKGCYDIGGRLIRIENGIISYASPKAVLAATDIGIKLEVNRKILPDDLSRITDRMNSVLEQAVGLSQPDELEKALRTPGSSKFEAPKRINHIFFSGGVADFIYHDSEGDLFPYGDIGFLLGRSIKRGKITKNINTCRPSETIRATVVGAGTYTTTISGSTITYTDDIFPVKNVPVLVLKDYIEKRCISQDGEMLVKEIKWFQKQCGREDIIIGLKGQSNLGYSDLRKLAENISEAALETMNKNIPIIIVVETDVAKALGQAIDIYLKGSRRVVCIDNIKVSQGDYVDMGKPLFGGIAVPVVVKTLIFG